MTELTDLQLLAELGVDAKPEKKKKRTPKEERIIAGFEEIQKFVDDNGHLPTHAEDNDIFERLYATRLDQIRKQTECRDLVAELDHQGLLNGASVDAEKLSSDIGDDELLAELGVEQQTNDVTTLKHVKTRAEKRAIEEMANRIPCEDFEKFKPLFKAVQDDLDNGTRKTKQFRRDAGFSKADIKEGHFFIVGGQTAYVADVGESFLTNTQSKDARLRVIYSNGTESDLLLRSMQRALYKDETSRIISDPSAGPLFSGIIENADQESGTIYVLRSKSDHPMVSENRDVLHKIGVTGGDVEKRIANAKHEATYLLADVEVVATYKLANINRIKLESLLHRIFEPAKLEIEIKDRFGNPVNPREWFLVPIFIIDEVVDRIRDKSIAGYVYDVESAKLVKR